MMKWALSLRTHSSPLITCKRIHSDALWWGQHGSGKDLWDFVIEAFQTPGLSVILIALLILSELILILIILLVHNGLLDLKFSYGGLGVGAAPISGPGGLRPAACWLRGVHLLGATA